MPKPLPPLTPGDHSLTFFHGQRQRACLVHVPAAYDPAQPWPLVLALHGGRTTPHSLQAATGLDAVADRAGVIVAFPSGVGPQEHECTWNAGNCCGYAKEVAADDVGFLGLVIDRLAARLTIDERRVSAIGLSNGGMMALRLAIEAGDRLAAVASVSGPLGLPECRLPRPIPLLYLHGTADEFVPYHGGIGPKALAPVDFRSALETVRLWRTANRAAGEPIRTSIPDQAGDGTSIEIEHWPAESDGAEVILYSICGGGHTWPGRPARFAAAGVASQNLDASETILQFCLRHSRR